ncbi:MAG: PIN domain-containing protein [Cyclobacteriaceae bacterium]
MVSKIFLDANVLLDFMLKREGYLPAKRIIEKIIGGRLNAFISPSIVHIVAYWLTKAYGSGKAKELILALLSTVRVIEIDHEITIHALHSKINDVEDALQYFTAVHHKLDAFISRDKQLRKAATPVLPVYSPDELLKMME